MKLNGIGLKNFRGIADIKISFDEKCSVIYGTNGMGKTAVLEACNIVFSKILNTVSRDKEITKLSITESDVKISEAETRIEAEIDLNGKIHTYYRRRTDGHNYHDGSALEEIIEQLQRECIGNWGEDTEEELTEDIEHSDSLQTSDQDIPVYVYYGINRHIVERRPIQKRYTGSGGKLDAWRDQTFDGNINLSLFFDWFRKKQEAENIRIVESGSGSDEQLNCAKNAILSALGEDFTAVGIKIINDNPEMMFTKNGLDLNLKQLSEGERTVIAFVGDLARRLSIANVSRKNPLEGEGIVLIDEIDLHLHPGWQAEIMNVLMRVFPGIQFIVTTHSPRVLSEMGDDVNIFKLDNAQGTVQAEKIKPLIGWDVNAILETWMGTEFLNRDTKEMIDQMYSLIEKKQYKDAEELVDRLETMTDEWNPDVVKGRILIHKGKKDASDTKDKRTK